MNKIIKYFLSASLLLPKISLGSHWAIEEVDRMELTTRDGKISVFLEREPSKHNVTLSLLIEGEKVVVNKEYLFNVSKFDPRTVVILTQKGPDNIPVDDFRKTDFCVSFAFGGVVFHGADKKGERVAVRQRVRVYFRNGKVRYSEMVVPSGDYKNRWQFLEYPKEEPASPYFEDRIEVGWAEAKQ